jgi:hypothetical protein
MVNSGPTSISAKLMNALCLADFYFETKNWRMHRGAAAHGGDLRRQGCHPGYRRAKAVTGK